VEHNIEVLRRNIQQGENTTATQGNAMDLSGFPSGGLVIILIYRRKKRWT